MKTAKPKKPKKAHPQIASLKIYLTTLQVEYVEEYRFHPSRQWRLDLAIPSLKIGIEYQGHGSTGGGHIGGHASIKGMTNDCEKLNQAGILGWTILKFTALYFRHDDRKKHKLTAPHDILTEIIKSKQIN